MILFFLEHYFTSLSLLNLYELVGTTSERLAPQVVTPKHPDPRGGWGGGASPTVSPGPSVWHAR